MDITIIAAMAENRVIGNNNKLPWHIKEELQHFKAATIDKPIIMGRKTFESLGNKLLPNRKNIILSRETISLPVGAYLADNIDSALELAKTDESNKDNNIKEVMILGGANIYKQFLKIADKIILSVINKSYDGDTFFPEFDLNIWKLESEDKRELFTIKTYIKP